MKKTSSKLYLISSILVLGGAGMKLAQIPYGDWIVITGMALGLFAVNSYINEIKKEQ